MLRSVKQMAVHVGKDAGQREHSSLGGGTAHFHSQDVNQCGSSSGRWELVSLKTCTTLGHAPKGLFILPQTLVNNVSWGFIHNRQKLEQYRCPLGGEWIKKTGCVYTMEYYSAIKNNDLINR